MPVNRVRKRRLIAIILMVSAVSIALILVLKALQQNINLFYTPSQIKAGLVSKAQRFRIGGMVVKGSVTRRDLLVSFVLTDTSNTVRVYFKGILPDLFREGQGVVALGQLNAQRKFIATQVLAKHDATYMPPEVKDMLSRQL